MNLSILPFCSVLKMKNKIKFWKVNGMYCVRVYRNSTHNNYVWGCIGTAHIIFIIYYSFSQGEPVELSSKFIRYSTFKTGKEQLVGLIHLIFILIWNRTVSFLCVCVCVLDNKRMCWQTEAAWLMCLLSTVSIACILTDRQPTTL